MWSRPSVCALALFALTCAAAVDERDSLRDLDGVKVVVEEAPQGLSRDHIQKDIESQLRRTGIKVLNSGEFPVGDPGLRVRVATTPERAGLVAYHVALEFAQVVFLRRDPTVTFNRASTWKAPDRIGLVLPAKLAEGVQHDLAEQVDQFIAAYYFVNPK